VLFGRAASCSWGDSDGRPSMSRGRTGQARGRARDVRDGDGDGSARVVGGSVALGGMAA